MFKRKQQQNRRRKQEKSKEDVKEKKPQYTRHCTASIIYSVPNYTRLS